MKRHESRYGRETAWGQHSLPIDGCWQARSVVHIHSFDALMQVNSVQRWGTSLKATDWDAEQAPTVQQFSHRDCSS